MRKQIEERTKMLVNMLSSFLEGGVVGGGRGRETAKLANFRFAQPASRALTSPAWMHFINILNGIHNNGPTARAPRPLFLAQSL